MGILAADFMLGEWFVPLSVVAHLARLMAGSDREMSLMMDLATRPRPIRTNALRDRVLRRSKGKEMSPVMRSLFDLEACIAY